MLSSIEDIGSEYQMVLDRKEDGRDYMLLRVEKQEGVDESRDAELVKTIKSGVKRQIMVSVDVEMLEYGSLPRSERKSKRVFDNREE